MTKLLLKIWPKKIRYQLIVGIVLVQMLIMLLFIGDTMNRQQNEYKKQNLEQAGAIARNLALNASAYISENDLSGLNRLITSNMSFPNLKYIMILSDDQLVLAHSDKTYLGLTANDSISRTIRAQDDLQILFVSNEVLDVAATVYNNNKLVKGWVRVGLGQENVLESKQVLLRDGAIYILLALIIGSLIALAIGSQLVKELYYLVAGSKRIVDGDHRFRVSALKGYETAQLGVAFNQMLDEINANERKLSIVLEHLPVGVWILNEEGKIIYGNKASKEIWHGAKYVGIDQYAEYKAWFVKTGKQLEAGEWGGARAILHGETHLNEELEIEAFDGVRKMILHSSLPIRDAKNTITGAVVINAEITEIKKAENLLKERGEQLRLFIEHSPASLAMFDKDMRYLITSKRWIKDYQLEGKALIGKTHYEVFPEITDEWKAIHQRCLAGATEKNEDDFFVRENGSIDWLKWEIHPWRKSTGEIGGIIMFTEITTHTKEAELKFRSLTEQSSVGVHIIQNGKYAYVNPFYADMFGMTADEMIGKLSPFDLIIEEDLPVFEKHYKDRLERKAEFVRYEVRGRKKNGDIIWIDAYGSRIQLAGKVALIGSFVDITQRKVAELQLKQSEEKNRLVLDAALDCIITVDSGSRITYWNQKAAFVFGWNEVEVKGHSLEDTIIPPQHRDAHRKGMAHYLKTGHGPVLNRIMEMTAVDRTGREFPIELSITPVLQNGVVSFTSFIRDITYRKQAEKEINSRIVQLQNISNNLPDTILYQLIREHDGQMKFAYISNGVTKLTGLTPAAVIENPQLMYQCIEEGDREKVRAEEIRSYETMSVFNVEVKFRLLTGEVRLMQIRSVPRLLDDGRVLWDGIQIDVTEQHQRQIEIRRLNRLYYFISQANELLLRTEKIEDLFSESCRIAVEYGGVRMAWIGIVNEDQTVVPLTWAGYEDGYLNKISISIDSSKPSGRGPTGRAIRSHTYYFCNDMETNPDMGPWRDEALERGYQSSISYPIIIKNKVEAVFTLYISEKNFFNETEIKLLQEVTDNIAFTLEKIQVKELHKQAEAELKRSEEINRAIVEAFPDKIFRIKQNGLVLDFHAYNEITLYVHPKEIIGQFLIDILPYEAANALMHAINKAFETQELVTLEYVLPIKNESRYHEGRIIAMTNGEALLVARDITEAKQMLDALRDSMKETADYKYAIDQASMVDIADRKGNILYANENFCNAAGYSMAELAGKNHKLLNSGYHSKEFFKDLWKTVGSGAVWRGEIREKSSDGSFFWVDTTIVPFVDDSNSPYQYLSIRKDITARKKAEEEVLQRNHEIKERMKELRGLYKISELSSKSEISIEQLLQQAMLIIPESYQYPEITCVRIDCLGYCIESENFLETKWEQNVVISLNGDSVGKIQVYYTEERPLEYEGVFLKEEREFINSLAQMLASSIERRTAALSLQESEQKFRSLVEQTYVGVYILQDLKFVYVNPGLEKISGYSATQLLNGVSLNQLIHDDDWNKVMENYQSRLSGGLTKDQYVIKVIRSDGEVRYVELILSGLLYNGKASVIGTVIDVTDRIVEETKINLAVTEAQERERLDIGMELHDNVKQILAISQLHIDIAKQFIKDDKNPSEVLDKTRSFIGEAIFEIRRLSHQLAPVVDNAIDFDEVIRNLVDNINHNGKLTIRLYIDELKGSLSKNLQTAVYRILQEQFSNIIKHADAKTVIVSLKQIDADIVLKIQDDGKGFDTTKEKSGIGLENIKRRAQIFAGTMIVKSKPGKGCEMIVTMKNSDFR